MTDQDHRSDRPSYRRPPVTEAVLALHFSAPIEFRFLDTYANKRKSQFPRIEDIIETTAAIKIGTANSVTSVRKIGKKLTNQYNNRIILANERQLSISHLAPYTNWEALIDDIRAEWSILSRHVSLSRITKLSTRYINRIDIPAPVGSVIDMTQYFLIGLTLPSLTSHNFVSTFYINCNLQDRDNIVSYTINMSGVNPPPLIDHISVILDIDCATVDNTPLRDDRVWELAWDLRDRKNAMFESCITDATRALFR
jgi:uncharacterized protein (TIGR04255 family)